jgi:hypothetical protein
MRVYGAAASPARLAFINVLSAASFAAMDVYLLAVGDSMIWADPAEHRLFGRDVDGRAAGAG